MKDMAWLITKNGFISAVEYSPGKDRTNQMPESLQPLPSTAPRRERRQYARLVKDGFILARARVRDDLEQLRPYFDGLTIVEDGGADYQWRAVVPRSRFRLWAAAIADGIDYDSHFKEQARDHSPADPERYHAMMSCWSALNRMGGATKKQWGYHQPGGLWSGHSVGGSRAPFGTGKSGKKGKQSDRRSTEKWRGTPVDPDDNLELDEWLDRHSILGSGSRSLVEDRIPRDTDTVTGMARYLLVTNVDKVFCDEFTDDDAFDLWLTVYDAMQGEQDRPAPYDLVMEVLEDLTANAKGSPAYGKFAAAVKILEAENEADIEDMSADNTATDNGGKA